MNRIAFFWILGASLFLLDQSRLAFSQQVRVTSESREKGKIRDIQPGTISLTTKNGRVVTCKIQDTDEQAIAISGVPMRMPARISVSGSLPIKLLEKGMIVKFEIPTSKSGKPTGEVQQLQVLADTNAELKFDRIEKPGNEQAANLCQVVGRVIKLHKQKLHLQIPKDKLVKKGQLIFKISENSTMLFRSNNLNRVQPGDEVVGALIYQLSSGEAIIKEIDIRLTADRDRVTTSFHDKLEQEYSGLSDELGEPRELHSTNFVLYTDISDRDAKILLAKLETMHDLIGGYFGKRPRIPIECYVVSDISKWQDQKLHPTGVAKIREPSGVTITVRHVASGQAKAVVYSCDKHSVVQHEAVHAFCAQAFGSPGPVWYSEGMAEMGQYWKPGELSVNIDPVVIDYLTNAPPKKMEAIVAAGQITGDSWQAYAWRWALCHLLASNPNYGRRFKKLGINIMAGGDDSFEKAFGNVAKNISFEYDQFVQNFGNGYRVDLCSWDWSVGASNLSSNGRTKRTVNAQAGWQPTKLETRKGVSYDYAATGEWTTAPDTKAVSGDGDSSGRGKLVGVILHDFQLEGPFEFGKRGTFVAPVDGQLYLRCKDSWTQLADNGGELTVHLRRTPKDKTNFESSK